MKNRIFAGAFLLLCFFALICLPAQAAESADALFSGSAAFASEWKCDGSVSMTSGGLAAVAKAGGATLSLSKTYQKRIDLFYYRSLDITATARVEGNEDAHLSVTLKTSYGAKSEFEFTLEDDKKATLSLPLAEFNTLGELYEISFDCVSDGDSLTLIIGDIAANGEIDATLSERFMCESFTADGGELTVAEDKSSLTLSATGVLPSIIGSVTVKPAESTTNVLRIRMMNGTRNEGLTLYYSYDEGGLFTEENSVSLEISTRDSEIKTYILALPRPEAVSAIMLRFDSSYRGELTVYSIQAVSTYTRDAEPVGEISSVAVSDDAKNIIIRGKIPSTVVTQNRKFKLALYALSPYEGLAEVDFTARAPLSVIDMSAKFEYRVPLESRYSDMIFNQYVVAFYLDGIITPYVLADMPKFPENAGAFAHASVAASAVNAFKGLECTAETLPDAAVGTSTVEADLSLLSSERRNGLLHTVDGENYYFSSDYVGSLDRAVASRAGTGADILLRLVVTNAGREVPFAFSFNESGVSYYALNTTSDEGIDYIAAAVDFLCRRYGERLCGFIVGRELSESGESNYMGTNVALDDYAKNCLSAARVVYVAANRIRAGIRVYLPLGDTWQSEALGRAYLSPNYDTMLFIEALASRAADEGGMVYSVLWQSDAEPFGEERDRTHIGADNLSVLTDYINYLAAGGALAPDSAAFLWDAKNADADALAAMYAYSYMKILFDNGDFDLFILSLGDKAPGGELLSLLTAIDTEGGEAASAKYADFFGISGWRDYFESFRSLALRDITNGALSTDIPYSVGSFAYYSADGAGASAAAVGSASTPEYRAESGALTFGATLAKGGSAGVSLGFTPAENMSFTDYITVDFGVSGAEGVTVKFIIGARGGRYESDAYPTASGRQTLCADISAFALSPSVEYVELVFENAGEKETAITAELYSVKGHSPVLDGGELESRILASRKEDTPAKAETHGDMWQGILIIIAVASIAVTMMISKGKKEN